MTTLKNAATAAAALLCALASGAEANPQTPEKAALIDKAKNTISLWPSDSRLLANRMLDELGAPDEVMPHYVTWLGHRPFNSTTVFYDRVSSNQPGVLMQSVSYRVPVGKWRALTAFGHGMSYDVVFNELVACSDAPETNLLAMNLADEVIQGRRSPEEARSLYDKILERSLAGRNSWYLSELRFTPSARAK